MFYFINKEEKLKQSLIFNLNSLLSNFLKLLIHYRLLFTESFQIFKELPPLKMFIVSLSLPPPNFNTHYFFFIKEKDVFSLSDFKVWK